MSVLGRRFKSELFTAAMLAGGLLLAASLQAGQKDSVRAVGETHRQVVEDWRSNRHAGLSAADGYLSQVGLEWLKEGENRVGSAPDNDVRIADGPAIWGSVFLENGQIRFVRAENSEATIDGELLNEARLIADTEGEATTVRNGTFSFYVIFRGSFALRVKDSQAVARLGFAGMDNYPISEKWLIDGRFVPAPTGTTIEIVNVLGQVSDSSVLGTFEFEMKGKSHSLLGLADEDAEDVWFIFADRTSGHGTYGAGRFLHSNGMPANGRLTVDFNKAYNPPCAFNPFSTCPLPPQRNRLDLEVMAGERDFHPGAG